MAGKCFVATLLAMTKGATDGGGIIADQVQSDGGGKPPQHSTTLTASPPFDVSLYLSRISRPVWSIVAITVSRLTTRSEEHTSELQSLMRISYAVFCLKKKKIHQDK